MSLTTAMAELVEAVRKHPEIGRGSASYIDETLSDEELAAILEDEAVKTPAGAIKHCLWLETLWSETP